MGSKSDKTGTAAVRQDTPDRFVFVGDVHFSSVQYGTRLDNSLKTLFSKLEFVLRYAESVQGETGIMPFVIFTGDFLNGNNNSTQSLLDLIDLFVPYTENFLCYTIGGNHELRGDDPRSLDASQLQFLVRAHVLNLLVPYDEDLIVGQGHLLRGWSAYDPFPDKHNPDMVWGLVLHHYLSSSLSDPLSVSLDDLIDRFPDLKFVVAGHDHAMYPVQSYRGVTIIRPGSLFRTSSAADSDRIPCVADVSVYRDGRVDARYVPVTVALPYGQVFDLEGKASRKAVKEAGGDIADRFISRFGDPTGLGARLEDVFSAMLDKVPSSDRDMVRADLAANGWHIV